MFFFFCASLRDPGYIQVQTTPRFPSHQKQSSSLGSNITASSLNRKPNTIESTSSISPVLKTYPRENYSSENSKSGILNSIHSERLEVSLSCESSIIANFEELCEENESLTEKFTKISISKPIESKPCPSSPSISSSLGSQQQASPQKKVRILEPPEKPQSSGYCTVCFIEQPLRSKHCSACERCVSTFDHHCPYLGNCIGERNRCLFYWFILTQLVEVSLGFYFTMNELEEKDDWNNWVLANLPKLLLGTVAFLLCLLLSLLVLYHTYLACKNLTTWENLLWSRISYLSHLNSKTSPFSEGCFKNLLYYCQVHSSLKVWEVNDCNI